MGYPDYTQFIDSAKLMSIAPDGSFNRTSGLWHVLSFLRHNAVNGNKGKYVFEAYGLSEACFDINGIQIPNAEDSRNVYFEPGASQGKILPDFFRHREGPRQTYLNRIQTGLTGGGPRQPKLFRSSGTVLPITVELDDNWIAVLRENKGNRNILDENISSLITWLFRFGIPTKQGSNSFLCHHKGQGLLAPNADLVLSPIPDKHDDLMVAISNYLGLPSGEIDKLLPRLKSVNLAQYRAADALNPASAGVQFVSDITQDSATNNSKTLPVERKSANYIYEAFFLDATDHSVGLNIKETHVKRFIASLCSKRLLILTGLSGSGKTKIAQAFASWISEKNEQNILVAVGADWTSNENILGYQDALQPNYYRKPSSGALDLILRASTDSEHPYFIILDEMNLSHVERYFADFLSAIESDEKISLHSALSDLNESDLFPVPPKVNLPKNLFIIGTVNIDETTYMFSPKVLDRSNVIEFRATKEDIEAFLMSPTRVNIRNLEGKGAEYGAAFVAMSSMEVTPSEIPHEIADGAIVNENLIKILSEIFVKLAPVGAEFGFRTAIEISRFVYYHSVLSGPGWDLKDALDAQVIQKLMPKLHGSDRKLRPTLEALKEFCIKYDLQLSLEKTNRMLDRLKDGFTSFAEA